MTTRPPARLIPLDLTPAQRLDRILAHGYTIASVSAECLYNLATGTYPDGWDNILFDVLLECDARNARAESAARQRAAWRSATPMGA